MWSTWKPVFIVSLASSIILGIYLVLNLNRLEQSYEFVAAQGIAILVAILSYLQRQEVGRSRIVPKHYELLVRSMKQWDYSPQFSGEMIRRRSSPGSLPRYLPQAKEHLKEGYPAVWGIYEESEKLRSQRDRLNSEIEALHNQYEQKAGSYKVEAAKKYDETVGTGTVKNFFELGSTIRGEMVQKIKADPELIQFGKKIELSRSLLKEVEAKLSSNRTDFMNGIQAIIDEVGASIYTGMRGRCSACQHMDTGS